MHYNNNSVRDVITRNNVTLFFDRISVLLTLSANTIFIPCIVCHGQAHNNTKPDPALANTNTITESSQCISCHKQKHYEGTSCTVCHTQDAHAIEKPSPESKWIRNKPELYQGGGSDMCMSMEGKDMDGKSRKFYNIVSHGKCILDERRGELK